MRQFSQTVLRNSAFGMAAELVIKILSFGFSVLVVRHLGAEIFGQYSAVLAFVGIFSIISDLGLSPYTVRQVARWRNLTDGLERANSLYSNIMTLRLLLSLLTIVIVLVSAWFTGRPFLMIGAIALNTLGLLLYSIQGTSDAILAGFERLDLSAGAKILNQTMFVSVGAVGLLVLDIGYYGLIIANLIGLALMTYVCWRGVRRLGIHLQWPVIQNWPALVEAGLPFGLIGFALGLSYKFDSVLLNIFRGDTETGYYTAAYNLVFSAILISNVLNTALYPSLTREATNTCDRLVALQERILRYLMVLSLPIAVGGWALADQLIPFIFTQDYLPAVLAFQIVIWVVPLMFASEFLGYVVVISDKERRVARAVLISTALNITFNLLLVPSYGFLAAAVMTVITEAVLVGQHIWTLHDQLRLINWSKSVLRPLLAALLMGVVVLLLRPYFPLLANIIFGTATYLLFLWILGIIGRDEMHFVQRILSPITLLSR